MDHKSVELLLDVPCRYTINHIKKGGVKELLKKIHDVDIFNIFILGTIDTINIVLKQAENTDYKQRGDEGMYGRNWAWFLITMVCMICIGTRCKETCATCYLTLENVILT